MFLKLSLIESKKLQFNYNLKSFYPYDNKRIQITFEKKINDKVQQNQIQAKMEHVWQYYEFEGEG